MFMYVYGSLLVTVERKLLLVNCYLYVLLSNRHEKVMVSREVLVINTSSFKEVNKSQTTNRVVRSNTSLSFP